MRHSRPLSTRPVRRQRGAFLIEAMLAIVIFSVGVLGILNVVGKMSVNSSDSRYRVEAASFSESIIADMRLASTATRVTDFSSGGARYNYWNGRITAAGSLPLVNAASGTLPLVVTFNGNQVTVTITWRATQDKDTTSGGTAVSHQFVQSTLLQ